LLLVGRARYCPVCGHSARKFLSFGSVLRKEAQCPYCDSLERHRLVWLYFQHFTDLFDGGGKLMLHVAPEPCLERRLKERLGGGYLSADLLDPHAMVRMDVTDIHFPDEHFDVVYCSHVLEHVPDDRRAMAEFYRVLKKDGWAILLVPISAEHTVEDTSIVEPADRRRVFGQEDHVRRYGPDYVDRLREAGFAVEVCQVADLVEREEAVRMGLTEASGEIFRCRKVGEDHRPG
jgi:SAM-dependent methyltransferase